MAQAEPLILRDFSGGVNSFVNDYAMQINQLRYAVNFYHDPKNGEYGSLTSRHGFSLISSLNASADPIDVDIAGIDPTDYHVGAHCRGADSWISAIQESDSTDCYTYHFNGASWSDIGGTPFNWGQNGKIRFATFLDYTFAGNGTYIKSWDGNTANNWGATNLTSAPTGDLLKVFLDKLYVSGNSTDPSRIYYSGLPASGALPTWDTTNDFIDISPDDGDSITALEVNSSLLLIFKRQNMYTWDGISTQAEPLFEVGAISQEVVQTIKGRTFFAGAHAEGVSIYMYEGGSPVDISEPVRGWLKYFEVTNFGALTNIGSFVKGDNYYISIHDIVRDGIEYTNVILCYSTLTGKWSELSIDKPSSSDNNNYYIFSDQYKEADTATDGFSRLSSNIEHLYTMIAGGPIPSSSAADNQLAPVIWSNISEDFNAVSGFALSTTDNGRPIPLYLQLPALDWGFRSKIKTIQKFSVLARGNIGCMTVQVRIDGGATGEQGNITSGLQKGAWQNIGGLDGEITIFDTRLVGRWFDFRLVGSNTGDPFIFDGIEFFDVEIEDFKP